jgi:arylsulfatase A-like enzyme
LTDRDKTVPEYLKEAGYTIGLIGKWGLGEEGSTGIPNKKGFDYFFGYLNQRRAHNYYPEFLWRNTEKVFLDNEQKFTKDGVGSAAVKRVQYSHDLFAEEALSFVEKNRDNPFFLYLALTIPHANNESWLVDRHGMEVPDYGEYEDKDWPEAQKGTAAMISRMDRDIGRIVDQLKKLGIDDDTIIMFSSDNGPHREGQNDPDFFDSNGAYRGIKRDLYEGGIRVPFIVRWPGKIEAGQVSHHISAFWDLLPTACELAGLETMEQPDGISFLPTLLGKPQTEHPYLYWEFFEQGGKQAVRAGKWKAVRLKVNQNPSGPLELYDLEQDPGEERNIAAEYPDVADDMAALLNKARTPSKHFQFPFEKKENVDQK